jgi:hypothetical protein
MDSETNYPMSKLVDDHHHSVRFQQVRLKIANPLFLHVKLANRTAHAAVYNLFNLGRYLVSASHYRNLGIGAIGEWNRAVA